MIHKFYWYFFLFHPYIVLNYLVLIHAYYNSINKRIGCKWHMFNIYTLTKWMLLEQELMHSLHLCVFCVSHQTWNFYEKIMLIWSLWVECQCVYSVTVDFLSHPTDTKSAKLCLTQEHLISTPFLHLWPWEIESQEKFKVCNVHAGVMVLCYGTVNAKSTCGTTWLYLHIIFNYCRVWYIK